MSESKQSVACPKCRYRGFFVVPDWELPEGVHKEPGSLVVKCSACGQHYRIRWEGQIRLALAGDNVGYDVSQLQIGDVLRLAMDMEDIPAGLWAVVELGWIVRLARCYENEDGELAMTHQQVTITQKEAERFEPMNQSLPQPL